MKRKHLASESGNGQPVECEVGDADLTAFALEQLSAAECRAIEARLRDKPEAQKSVAEIRRLAGLLRASAPSARVAPSPQLRDAIERQLARPPHEDELVVVRPRPAARRNLRRLLVAVSAISAVILLVILRQQLPDWERARHVAVSAQQSEEQATVALQPSENVARTAPAEPGKTGLDTLVQDFDEKLNERHYDDAAKIAQRAKQIAPNSDVVKSMEWKSRFVKRIQEQLANDGSGQNGFYESVSSVSVPQPDASDAAVVVEERTAAERQTIFSVSADGRAPAPPTSQGALLGWGHADVRWNDQSRRYPPSVDFRTSGVNSEQYDAICENEFAIVRPETALSTFSIDVDTASYANVRRFLTHNTLPPPNAVRIEELVNYFQYDYPQPRGRHPFSVNMEVAQCPWTPNHLLLRIGLRGKQVDVAERPAGNLVFLLDVSGSMRPAPKLPLLKRAMRMLVEQLTENDRVTIVTYAGQAGLRLDTTTGDRRAEIDAAIDSLNAGGSTNGSAGIQLAYQKAVENFVEDGTNRVILATDGDLNVGISDDERLVQLIQEKAASGVFLTVLGFGTGNLKDSKLEKLADHGNGMYGYVDSLREARKVLVEQVMGSLVTIAKDVKIQVEFNPAEVRSYRLIGYENRLLAAQDFHDDTKDAGEIGAGHTVTALYELEPAGASAAAPSKGSSDKTSRLKYQHSAKPEVPPAELTEAAESGELLTLSLRYKPPEGNESSLIEVPLSAKTPSFQAASDDFRFASMVAAFGMLLRGSHFCGDISLDAVEEWASCALGSDPQGRRTEFVDLVRRAKQLRGK